VVSALTFVMAGAAAGRLLASLRETCLPLMTTEFKEDVCLSILIYLVGYAALGGFSPLMPTKRKAWIMSVLCSLGMSLGSLPYVYRLVYIHGFDTGKMVYADDRLSVFVMSFFMTFLVLDIVVGLRIYPSEISFLTGWFHHSLYMCACLWAMIHQISISAVATMIMEVPTLVMALGRLDKSMRNDFLFGSTFFATRIVYLGIYIYKLMCDVSPRVVVWPVCLPAMALHLFWFQGFIQQQMRLRTRSSEAGGSVGGKGEQEQDGKGGKAA